ncbi:MAG: branched-chain amino acid ABC transporter substrate-binding protein [Betaproteobacteria bacterium]|nr:MAG: branched-chain amino acid ABC transporter substrate-binding protein [Betaproteobacteria bacterium]
MRKSPQPAAWAAIACFVATIFAGPSAAEVKLAFIDPLSGGAASAGINAQKHFTYEIDKINAAGGLNGEKLSIVFYDNKVDPQESLIALKKALDDGARYIFQGNGSAVALAISDAVLKYNERNPGKEVLYFNYAAVDPALTNAKCNFWHFRFDSDADMKMTALVNFIATQPQVKKVYLINQDYSFGKAVASAARRMLADKRPDVEIVGDELHPLQKVQDFSPYVAKIKASGADTVITGNWSNDMYLLFKAGKDAGLKVTWYTYYADALGAPTAIGRDGNGVVKVVTSFHGNALPEPDPDVAAFRKRFTDKLDEFNYYRLNTAFMMLTAAAAKAKSNDPVKIARALEGMKLTTSVGDVEMRADNHQLLQPLYVATFSDNVKFDVEKTGLGFKTDVKVTAKDTAMPTTCQMQRPNG